MRYSFAIYLIGRESKITNLIGRENRVLKVFFKNKTKTGKRNAVTDSYLPIYIRYAYKYRIGVVRAVIPMVISLIRYIYIYILLYILTQARPSPAGSCLGCFVGWSAMNLTRGNCVIERQSRSEERESVCVWVWVWVWVGECVWVLWVFYHKHFDICS